MRIEKPRTIDDAIELVKWYNMLSKHDWQIDVTDWCKENLDLEYITIANDGIYFYDTTQLLLFKLRWQ